MKCSHHLVGALVLAGTLAGSAPIEGARVTVGTASAAAGGTASLSLSFAAEGANVAILQVDLLVSAPLSYASSTAGAAATAAGKQVSASAVSGGVRLLIYGLNQNRLGDGVLATLSYAVASGAGAGTYTVSATNAAAADPSGAAVSLAAASGSVTVTGGGGATGTLQAGSASGCSGQSIAIPISISSGSGTLAIQFDLVFDGSKLTAVKADPGSIASGFSVSANPTLGRMRVAMASGSPLSSASGEVARVTFTGGSGLTAGSSAPIRFENVSINDRATSGQEGSVSCSSCKKGDVNGNGQVSALDASMVLQSVVGSISLSSTQTCAADFNSDGRVTAFDASLILQCIVNSSCP